MNKGNSGSLYNLLFKSGIIYNFLLLLFVMYLIDSVDGFSNPQLLQREYYYFYPELFDELPESIQESVDENLDASVEHDQNHWMPVTEEEFGLMGDTDMETPYLMEELYLVQDDVRDMKTKLEIIGNEVGVRQPGGATCTKYEVTDINQVYNPDVNHPCNIIIDSDECDNSEYCEHNSISNKCEVKKNTNGNAIEIDCSEQYENNGGLIRYSCPWVCQYQNKLDSPKVQGGFLLTETKILKTS